MFSVFEVPSLTSLTVTSRRRLDDSVSGGSGGLALLLIIILCCCLKKKRTREPRDLFLYPGPDPGPIMPDSHQVIINYPNPWPPPPPQPPPQPLPDPDPQPPSPYHQGPYHQGQDGNLYYVSHDGDGRSRWHTTRQGGMDTGAGNLRSGNYASRATIEAAGLPWSPSRDYCPDSPGNHRDGLRGAGGSWSPN